MRTFWTLSLLVLLAFTGCSAEPNPKENGSGTKSGDGEKVSKAEKDDEAAVNALKKAEGVKLTFNDEKLVTGVVFTDPAGDQETEHLKGLPNVTTLALTSPGITDEGLKNI